MQLRATYVVAADLLAGNGVVSSTSHCEYAGETEKDGLGSRMVGQLVDVLSFAIEILCRALKFRGLCLELQAPKRNDLGTGGYTPGDPVVRDCSDFGSDVTAAGAPSI